ncbi:MAG: 2-C-methyl-D-erythritol 4-phosphate cytidylyltransferase [Candidatus Latescibacterota bacterium]|nr:MAG: 2-C-methyl-D-erythritol 4-phosphate cytidylyltransferase [Candidatus Latescibacterota bacterium]
MTDPGGSERDVVALVVAAGQGTRLGGETPKQFRELGDRMLLTWAVQALARAPSVQRFVIVVTPGWEERVRHELARRAPHVRVAEVVSGGATRQDSVWHGLQAAPAASHLLVHDAARPFPTPELVESAIMAARRCGAATVALAVADTLMRADESTAQVLASATLERRGVWAIQTPQVFDASLLREAHVHAREQGLAATDDCSLVLALGRHVELVRGSSWNIKVTEPEDWPRAAWILRAREEEIERGDA